MRSSTRLLTLLAMVAATPVSAQWHNRYPLNAGYGHQVYVEGYDLPSFAAGPGDVAASPDGRHLALTAQGWLWLLDLASGEARRLTRGAAIDARPAWSPDGSRLAFVRDDGRTTALMLLQVASGDERELDRGFALDPAFAADGALLYTNLDAGGDLDLRRIDLATGTRTRLTTARGLELRPMPHPDGARLLYVSKSRATADELRLRHLGSGADTALLRGNILSQFRPALSPDGRRVVYGWPTAHGWELRLLSLDQPGTSAILVAKPRGRPLTPAWSADGRQIFFSEADAEQRLRLYRVAMAGGAVEEMVIRRWSWGTPTAQLVIDTRDAARLSVTTANGHPIVPARGLAHFDGQNGIVYFHAEGRVALTVPAGQVTVLATRGLATVPERLTITAAAGSTTPARLALRPVWDAPAHGWYSADHHFHLNYGGMADLRPESMLTAYRAEALDVATPMLANLAERNDDMAFWRWRSAPGTRPMVAFAHEVRSHFLGHVGLLGTREPFWPWGWGPGYDVYPRDDRPNVEPLAFARASGGLGAYVHPSEETDPFATDQTLDDIPLGLIPDAVLGDLDLLEVMGLWNNSVGATALWYQMLNAGLPVMPVAGTDMMADFHRTMAVGSTRVYAQPVGALTWRSWFDALRTGRSFVTSGPMIELSVDGTGPGGVVRGGRAVPVTIGVHSAMRVDSIALVINGRTIASEVVPAAPFSRRFTRTVSIPAGGWMAVRVIGPPVTGWPSMADRTFAHTAPVWFGARGSTESTARRAAALELSRALGRARNRVQAGYAGTPIPQLLARFDAAGARLESLAR